VTYALRSPTAALAAGLALATGLATGCSIVGGGDDWVPLDEALATRQDVRDLTQELAAIITDVGLDPVDADGSWTTCTDDGYAWQYESSARLDTEGPSLDALQGVLDAVVDQTGMVTDGPGAYNNPEVARGTVGDLDIRVRGYADGPELILEVFGPCMPIASDVRDDLDQGDIGDQVIDINGTHPDQNES
jgi:hypothetical protein